MTKIASQRGFLMLLAVVVIIIIGFIGLAASFMFTASVRSSADHLKSTQSLYLADAGLEQATYKLLASTLTNRSACSGLNVNNTLGAGSYLTTGTSNYVSAATTLNGALSAIATTIPVVNTAGYQSSGRIMVDRELINYADISGNNFVGAIRGVDGSVAVAHATGVPVGQYQCTLDSEGGVPNLSAPANPGDPIGKRTLRQAVQLQEAWAVGGITAANTFGIERWNNPTEIAWNSATVTLAGAAALNSVYATSYVDAWAVGEPVGSNLMIAHWNGTAWLRVLPAVALNSALNSVHCENNDDCWAVGNSVSGNLLLERWNGTTWARVLPAVTLANNLSSVNCVATNDCWAVGIAAGSNLLLERWNGTNWTRVLPAVAVNSNLTGVYCVATNDCWAVGSAVGANLVLERWNGTSWSRVLPAVAVNGALNGIYCAASNDCWAVGNAVGSNLLLEHWNGTNWSRTLPAVARNQGLTEVACADSSDCWAVGSAGTTEHWDGTSWVQVTSPLGVVLNGVTIVNPRLSPQAAWEEIFP